ncbi:DUF2238 domain-containing protein [Methanoculleus sp. Wushi-C6]|uniref:DUF2238 domain-containing protein n=2 Tax=Methanoculleus caldifontis TaxID=2651577 RepID=A0ABU3WYR8_9EURY|nr:DUF2238 domain-containing protein [Methanoculleus sp. Wushi-C6]
MACLDPPRGAYLTYVIQGLILLSAVSSVTTGRYFLGFLAGVTFILALVPAVVQRNTPLCLPWEVHFLIAVSLYLHIMGHVGDYYVTFAPYYDKLAHFVASITVALLSISLAALAEHQGLVRLTRPALAVFVLVSTLAAGVVWEIYEFVVDQALGTGLQLGNTDTMLDLIVDFIGAAIISGIVAFAPESSLKLQFTGKLDEISPDLEPGSMQGGAPDPVESR